MPLHILSGFVMILVGGLKTWLHMGSIPVLTLPTCNGGSVTLPVGQSSWIEQAHCWGCYMFAAGVIVLGINLYQWLDKRRTVATQLD